MRESEHFFFKLSALQERLRQWVESVGQGVWRPNVYGFTMNWLTEGLRDRAITRDVDWGVPLPIEGYDDKRIYVWFEACTGYLSAAIEWSEDQTDGRSWRDYWTDPSTRGYYFIGKDNIPFHTIVWPGMLVGYSDDGNLGQLNLPVNVPANEFLSLEGQKFSTSQNWAVWVPDYLERYDPDPLRYYLSANMPEFGDADFSWREFYRRNNDELVATFGNLVHRVLTMTHRNFDGVVPAGRGTGRGRPRAHRAGVADARRRGGEPRGAAVPRGHRQGDGVGGGRQPLHRPEGALAHRPRGPGTHGNDPEHCADGHRGAEDGALPVHAACEPAAARAHGLRLGPCGRRVDADAASGGAGAGAAGAPLQETRRGHGGARGGPPRGTNCAIGQVNARMETTLSFYAPIAEDLRRVEESLAEVAAGSDEPIKGLLEHVVAVQGKRVRPSITLLVAKMLGCTTDKPVIMGAAVELLHLATLIHDDTVDNADVRRGRATLSSLYGPDVAVLVGDYLFASSAIHVCNTENIRVIKGFSRTIMDLSSGQLNEHFMSNQWGQTREQYMERIYKKTGSLFATAAESGALLSGADEGTVRAIREFGSNLGTAFQVVDDILDFEGTAAEIGKPVGSDLASGVLTLPALLLVERYPEKNPVVAVCEGVDREANLEQAVDMVRNSGVMADVYAEADALRSRAIDALAPLPDSEAKRALLELSDFVLERHV